VKTKEAKMSYLGISIKEAMERINNGNNGWFLPEIQRPYVWGSRYQHEVYICKLFDSILKLYPIGGLIVWNTEEEVPYREFINDYKRDETPKIVDKGLWSRKDKWLIYDGQQRLQTLYSCLRFTFNEKVLVFDLLYNLDSDDQGETGFKFVQKNEDIKWHEIRMNELFVQNENEKLKYRKQILSRNSQILQTDEAKIESNIEKLWDVFVKRNEKSLAYFEIKTDNKDEVNEIFERLNTGGMALSFSDILFSKLKDKESGFEENLQDFSKKIYKSTGNGYIFNADNTLQLLNLIIKNSTRIDPQKIKENELKIFIDTWDKLKNPLISFFTDYLWGQFKINHNSIIPRNLAILPIIVYFYEIYNNGSDFKRIKGNNLQTINQYFIKSQINDWNLPSFIDNFTKIIQNKSHITKSFFDFPLIEIENHINEKKRRQIDIYEKTFVDYVWFALKILTPNRIYQFSPDMKNRFNPEIDHIFPKKLKNMPPNFSEDVDILWNLQPTKGDINGYKLAIHPKLFFTDQYINSKNETVIGSKYINEYDFLIPILPNKNIDFSDSIWDRPLDYIEKRKEEMLHYLLKKYDIKLI
jgi:uncharacterized protein with ParB-like and HNH nuclease domain